jgi:hypothetical protein
LLDPETMHVIFEFQIEIVPTLEFPVSVLLLPIPDPYEVDTPEEIVEFEIVIARIFEPSDPYPLPIPELLVPLALILEFTKIIDPAVETP